MKKEFRQTERHSQKKLVGRGNFVDVYTGEYYMAPERSVGISKPASDQYSLAVITYEWFTGKSLPGEIIPQRLTTSPSSQLRHAEQIPPPVKQALLKALARNPEARFDSVTAFVAALGI